MNETRAVTGLFLCSRKSENDQDYNAVREVSKATDHVVLVNALAGVNH